MAQAIITPDQDAVVSEIDIAAPPLRVFQALVDSRQLFRWWGAEPAVDLRLWEIDPRVGGKWRMECSSHDGKAVNGVTDFEAHGEILELDSPRLLAYSWIANWHDNPSRATVVTWELASTATGTKVKVTHSGLFEEPTCRHDYSGGWPGVLELLGNFLKP